jgi:hypothetical protein
MLTRQSLLSLITLTLSLVATQPGWAKVEYDSTSLLIKSSDQIGDMVKKKIRKAQQIQSKQEDSEDGEIAIEPEALEQLKDALRIVLARPDQDGARANLYSRIRGELTDLNSLDQALVDLTEEALTELRTQDGPRRTATYVVILENLMAEIRPEMTGNPTFRKIIERIRDAKIAIEDKAKLKNLLRSMSVPVSPSLTAQKILEKEPAAPTPTKGK